MHTAIKRILNCASQHKIVSSPLLFFTDDQGKKHP